MKASWQLQVLSTTADAPSAAHPSVQLFCSRHDASYIHVARRLDQLIACALGGKSARSAIKRRRPECCALRTCQKKLLIAYINASYTRSPRRQVRLHAIFQCDSCLFLAPSGAAACYTKSYASWMHMACDTCSLLWRGACCS